MPEQSHDAFFYHLSLHHISHVVLSPNAHRPSPVKRFNGMITQGRWAMVVKSAQYQRGGVFLYPEIFLYPTPLSLQEYAWKCALLNFGTFPKYSICVFPVPGHK